LGRLFKVKEDEESRVVDDLVVEIRLKCPRCGTVVSVSRKTWKTTCHGCGKPISIYIGMGGIIDIGEEK